MNVARFVEETRWLLQTQDRVGSTEFLLKHEFLAVMLGVRRPTVTLVMGALHRAGLITSRYGHVRVLKRRALQDASCECHEVIREHFRRLRVARRANTASRRYRAGAFTGSGAGVAHGAGLKRESSGSRRNDVLV